MTKSRRIAWHFTFFFVFVSKKEPWYGHGNSMISRGFFFYHVVNIAWPYRSPYFVNTEEKNAIPFAGVGYFLLLWCFFCYDGWFTTTSEIFRLLARRKLCLFSRRNGNQFIPGIYYSIFHFFGDFWRRDGTVRLMVLLNYWSTRRDYARKPLLLL